MATCPKCQHPYDAGMFCPRDGTRLVADAGPGAVLGGRYRLIRMVGAGGVGEVYEAEHVFIHRKVAVKILRREIAADPEAVERLQREAQSTSGLGHPNIIDCLDFGYSDEGQVYLVMEWLEGENLDQRLHREAVDIPTALEIAAQVASGLAEAHDRGVVHRDLKPANLFLTRDRRRALVVKVLDFGIAKLAAHQTKLTGTGVLVGTPNYMAPEQAFGESIDARTDVYALGVILYEMVTGSVPFHADSPLAVLHQHTARMPVPPSARAPERGISPDVEAFVMRCLAKRADERFASMHEVLAAIEAIRGGTAPAVIAPPPALVPEHTDEDLLRAAGVGGGRRLALVLGGLVLVVGVGVAAVLALRGGADERRRAAMPPDAALPVPVAADAAAPPIDAAPIALLDATPIVVALDAGEAPPWTHDGRGDSFAYRATVAAPGPEVGRRFALQLELTELGSDLRAAADRGTLRLAISLAHFKDHAVVQQETYELDTSLRLAVPVEVTRGGKYHVRFDLLDGAKPLDHARFDVTAKSAP